MKIFLACSLLVGSSLDNCRAFLSHRNVGLTHGSLTTNKYGFFQDLLKDAFENDGNLSSDKAESQIEGPNDVPTDNGPTLTATQQRWRDANNPKKGAPINASLLEHSKWELDLYLAGVPARDPSSDLYGSKTNISRRNRQVGVDVPEKPSVTVEIELLPGGVCKAAESEFTDGGIEGQWLLSAEAKTVRISIDVIGYSRTVQTKGSIQQVFWSDGDEVTTKTTSTYSIPPGFIYGDISIGYGVRPGTIQMENNGIIRVEKSSGLLGAASKMVPCGTFSGRQKLENADLKTL